MGGQEPRHAVANPDGHGQPSIEAVRLSGAAGPSAVRSFKSNFGSLCIGPPPGVTLTPKARALEHFSK